MKIRKITVLVLSLMMVLSMGISVFAEGETQTTGNVQKNSGTTVYLTKDFVVPQGVAVPTEVFSFTATPVTDSGENDLVSAADYNGLNVVFGTENKISFADTDRNSETDTHLVKTADFDFASLSFPRAGLYEWKIAETNNKTEKITYSSDVYTIRVYVKNGDKGTTIDTITVETPAKKVDAGVTDSDVNTDTDGDGDKTNDGNEFKFTNSYTDDVTSNPSDDPNNPNDEKGAFELTKTVVGDYADQTREFVFNVTVTLPEGAKAADYPTGITNGQVSIKHGDTFRIAKLPVGTTITVEETAANLYIPSYEGKDTAADGTVATIAKTAGTKSNALAVSRTIVVGAKGACIDYTNTLENSDVTPTGIVINNLPYILLIMIALGGIVLFSRKRRYE